MPEDEELMDGLANPDGPKIRDLIAELHEMISQLNNRLDIVEIIIRGMQDVSRTNPVPPYIKVYPHQWVQYNEKFNRG